MKRRFNWVLAVGGLVCLGGGALSMFAQETDRSVSPRPPGTRLPQGVRSSIPTVTQTYQTYQTVNPNGQMETHTRVIPTAPVDEQEVERRRDSFAATKAAMEKLRSPRSSDAEKKEAKESLASLLDANFEAEHKARREQLEKLEEQVASLRKHLDKRETSKARIIELTIELAEHDTDGMSLSMFQNGSYPSVQYEQSTVSLPSSYPQGTIPPTGLDGYRTSSYDRFAPYSTTPLSPQPDNQPNFLSPQPYNQPFQQN
jgi:hypothetical protein